MVVIKDLIISSPEQLYKILEENDELIELSENLFKFHKSMYSLIHDCKCREEENKTNLKLIWKTIKSSKDSNILIKEFLSLNKVEFSR